MPKVPPRLNPDDPVQGLALDLRTMRLRAGSPSLAELARAMSCSHSTVSAYLNGHRLPAPDQLRAFALACGADPAHWLAKLEDVHGRLSRAPAASASYTAPSARPEASQEADRPQDTPVAGPGVMTACPQTIAEARALVTRLRTPNPLIIDLTGAAGADGRRIADHITGLAAGAGCTFERTAGRVFVLLPPGVPASLRDQAVNDAYRLGAGLAATASQRQPPRVREEAPVPDFAIRIVGVGGAGINVGGQMTQRGEARLIAVDTDPLALVTDKADVQLELTGPHSGDPRRLTAATAAQTAGVHRDELASALAGADLVFIVVGEGGATGTGAAPVIANVARAAGALTIAVASMPFSFEGPHRAAVAADGVGRLRDEVDTLLVVPYDRLLQSGTVAELFGLADAALVGGLRCILDPIERPGLINLDFADIKRTLSGGGLALTGTGTARGSDRAVAATGSAISSMLAQAPFQEARTMLMSLLGGPDVSLNEISEAAQIVSGWGGDDVDFMFAACIDEEMADALQVTIIAAGISGSTPRSANENFDNWFEQVLRDLNQADNPA